MLADGRELIDGIASWWTACHGYNHRHIRDAVRRQLDVMPHVMFGGLAHKPAYTGLLDLPRDFHRLRADWNDVRLRAGRRRPGHRHALESPHRRHAAAVGGNARKHVFEAFWSDDPWTTRCTP